MVVRRADTWGNFETGFVFSWRLDAASREDGVLWACIDDRAGSPTRHRLFVGARHPDDADAKLVELGDEIEGLVVSALSWWIDDGCPDYHGAFVDVVSNAVLRLGDDPGQSRR